MTPQKVCDILLRIIDEDWHVYTDDAINALEYAAKIVNKEIAKKPVKIEKPLDLEHWGQIATKMEYHCPNSLCSREVLPYTIFEHGNTKETVVRPYCPFCGQKLDWEEKDEGV